ncbi:MAG: leucine--tRNA ligase [Phycisphaerales bacterium]|nr:leucine--tRNA ligase [Phycisphaerales bacterium]
MADEDFTHRYDAALAGEIEVRWQREWQERGLFRTANPGEPGFDAAKPKYYILDMFPYPSGAGLHVGHPEGYTATDIVARYKAANGFNVLHPMGWDAFGLPAEQYAVQTGVHPAVTTKSAIDSFRRQLARLGFRYDWSREFGTIDPEYFRWTQWIWLLAYSSHYDTEAQAARPIAELEEQLAKLDAEVLVPVARGSAGRVSLRWSVCAPWQRQSKLDDHRLAYLGEQSVNWCPKLGTVLANEEVIDGLSERGGHPVLRMPLRQWMFRITAYAQRLLDDLALVDWPDSTRTMQTEWIGRSAGALVKFAVEGFGDLSVFTTRPDTLFGATYMVVAPEHPLIAHAASGAGGATIAEYAQRARNRSDVDRQAESKEKTGVPLGLFATNPVNDERIPIWTADYVLMGYGTGAIMAVPAHDERDFEFAKRFGLPIRQVVACLDGSAWTGEHAMSEPGLACGSSHGDLTLDGLTQDAAIARIVAWLEQRRLGERRVNFKLRDWLFSRQRYWGEPFPVVFDKAGMHYPVSISALPVELPVLADYAPVVSDRPTPPLGKATQWVNTTAGAAGVDPSLLPPSTPVTRETNTMPGWAGSCWYYLRYCDPKNSVRFVSKEAEAYWMGPKGVDLYIGGSEHAVLHLLYARFWHKMLYDLGEVSTKEPFAKLFHQGMITSFAYERADGSLVPASEVDLAEPQCRELATGACVTRVVAKMSKSLKNVVTPDEVVAEYGADTLRLYEMAMGPLAESKPWNTRDIAGVFRFLQRVWRLAIDERTGGTLLARAPNAAVERQLSRSIHKVGHDIERLAFNTAIAALIEAVNAATRPTQLKDPEDGGFTRDQMSRFLRALAPFAPHIAEELWSHLGEGASVSLAPWPSVDPLQLVDDTVEMPVQIQGKVRARVMVPAGADRDEVERIVLADAAVQEHLAGRAPTKVIVVPARMVNLLV